MVSSLLDRILGGPGVSRTLTPEEMRAFAESVDLDTLDLGEHEKFEDACYARNTVFANEHFELVVICWKAGQASAVHDHGNSHCLYLVVDGEMTEDLYDLDRAGAPRLKRSREWGRGAITISEGPDIHCIKNESEEPLVTVHIYSPPLGDSMTMFTPIPRTTG